MEQTVQQSMPSHIGEGWGPSRHWRLRHWTTICSTEDVGFKGNGLVKVHFQKYIPVVCCYHPVPCKLDVFELWYHLRASRFPMLLPTDERRDNSYHWLPLARETTRAAAHCTLCCGDILTFLLLLGQWLQALFHLKILPRINKLHDGRYCSPYSEKNPFLGTVCYL